MKDLATLLEALASLLWPIFAFLVLYIFRSEISHAIGRLKKGKLLGQEFELDLEKLERSAVSAQREIQLLPPQEAKRDSSDEDSTDAVIKEILEQATTSPKVALITLWEELEKRARQALATRGLLKNRPSVSINEALKELHQYGLPPNVSGSLKLFADVRNKLIHGAADDDDVLRAVDSGITILKALSALPNELNTVYYAGVTIYSNAECSTEINNAKGLILETVSPGGVIKTLRIFPTTRTHFKTGKQVAWEWNMEKIWGQAWYKDPDSGKIKEGWRSAAEFIGRHLDEI